MQVLSFVMQKGGSFKTTLATQLAVYAQQQGEKALIIDLDPQRSAVAWSQIRAGKAPESVPSLPARLGDVIKQARQMFGKTLICVDTAPHTEAGALEAIQLANIIICPTKSSVLDINSIRDTIALIDQADCRAKTQIVVTDITPGRGEAADYDRAVSALKGFNIRICTTFISHRKAYVTAVDRGLGVTELAPKDKAASEIRELWDELHLLQPTGKNKVKTA
jgi:chromosome partitioning protein